MYTVFLTIIVSQLISDPKIWLQQMKYLFNEHAKPRILSAKVNTTTYNNFYMAVKLS